MGRESVAARPNRRLEARTFVRLPARGADRQGLLRGREENHFPSPLANRGRAVVVPDVSRRGYTCGYDTFSSTCRSGTLFPIARLSVGERSGGSTGLTGP